MSEPSVSSLKHAFGGGGGARRRIKRSGLDNDKPPRCNFAGREEYNFGLSAHATGNGHFAAFRGRPRTPLSAMTLPPPRIYNNATLTVVKKRRETHDCLGEGGGELEREERSLVPSLRWKPSGQWMRDGWSQIVNGDSLNVH